MNQKNKQPIYTIDDLTPLEKKALNKFLGEAYKLYEAAGDTGITFDAWLSMLTEGIHEAFLAHFKGKDN